METYLTIMVTLLVITQIIRVTQNHISLRRQNKAFSKDLQWIKENEISKKDFEVQRKVFYLLYEKLSEKED
ncbi:MAG: hypothetical protein IJZ23_07840 [Roseburia sp.]|nr:hypothetical protein [Roseburia sp.]